MVSKGRITGLFLILGLCVSVSCKDDEVDCDSIEVQHVTLQGDLLEAVLNGNCAQITKLFAKNISLLRKGKSCEYVTDFVAGTGYSDLESYIDYLEEERDRILDVLDC